MFDRMCYYLGITEPAAVEKLWREHPTSQDTTPAAKVRR